MTYVYRQPLLVLFLIKGSFCQSIVLTPTQANVDLDKNFTFTCKYIGYDVVQHTRWNVGKVIPAIVRYKNGTCGGTGLFADNTKYNVNCPSDTSFTVTILRVDFDDHNVSWGCFDFTRKSNSVAIFVKVPASNVILRESNGDYMIENHTKSFTCSTSACRPKPKVEWFLQNNTTEVVYNLTKFSHNRYLHAEYDLNSAESVLEFEFNRTHNNVRLYCEVWTRSDTPDIRSRKVIINVTYPPDEEPVIKDIGNKTIMRVTESETETLVCSILGGNPLALLSWDCFGSNVETTKTEENTVTSIITFTALRNFSTCSCTSYHMLGNWKRTKSISVDVRFPSEIKSFFITPVSLNSSGIINETESTEFVCIAEANPSSNLTIANPFGDVISEVSNSNFVRHTLRNAKCNDAGEYTCTGRNDYNRGLSAKSKIPLIIRCPPRPSLGDTNSLKITTRLHVDATLYFSARKYLEQPGKTVFKWLKGNIPISTNDSKRIVHSDGLQTFLIVRNVSQDDIGHYQVQVRNSAGQYVHHYELFIIADLKETTLPSRSGAFVGVGLGACFSTLVIVTLAFVINKRLKKSNVICNKRYIQKGNTEETQASFTEGNQASVAYTELDGVKREENMYDKINAHASLPNEEDSNRKTTSVEMNHTRTYTKESTEYINIAI